MKTVKAANGCRLTKGTQPYCWCQVHLFVSDWLLVCLLLSATFAVCCFTFLSLSVQPRCVYFSLSLSNKKGRNHTRQELISQAANSRSRWSIFFFPSKMKGPNESSDLICDPRRNRAHEIVFSSGRSTLSLLFLSFYFTLFTPLLISTHLPLWVCTGHRCTARSAASEWLHPVLYRGFVPRGSFHSSHLHSFFFFWHVRHL